MNAFHLVLESTPPTDWIANPWLSPTIRQALLGTADTSSPLLRLRGNHHLLHRIMLLALTYREMLEGVSLAWKPHRLAMHIAGCHPSEQKWAYNLLHLRLSYDFLDDRAQVALWGQNVTNTEYLLPGSLLLIPNTY